MAQSNEKRINPFLQETDLLNYENSNQKKESNEKVINSSNLPKLLNYNNEVDNVNMISNEMTASYSEISFDSNFDNPRDNCHNPDQPQSKINRKHQQRPDSLVCAFPYDLEGTVSKDGEMTHFVAENLEYKIKLSSPITKKDLSQQQASSSSTRNSTPSTSGIFTKQFVLSHQQQQLPQLDSNVLNDIELEAQYLAASVDNLTENLCNLLHSISSITADNVEIHKNAVNKLTDSMDANIKCMYTIMAKTEEISKSMKPTEQLAGRIREIKRLVDMLDGTM